MKNNNIEIIEILNKFQKGYTDRDITKVDEYVNELFIDSDGISVIGTSAIKQSDEEWCLGVNAVSNIIRDDWKYWGEVLFDIENANITFEENVAIVSMTGNVSEEMKKENYYNYRLSLVKETLENINKSSKDKLFEINKEISDTLNETEKGELYNWPLRVSIILIKKNNGYKIIQVHFSYPITSYPQVRI